MYAHTHILKDLLPGFNLMQLWKLVTQSLLIRLSSSRLRLELEVHRAGHAEGKMEVQWKTRRTS